MKNYECHAICFFFFFVNLVECVLSMSVFNLLISFFVHFLMFLTYVMTVI